MSSSLFLPNPCLLGIILTVSTHDGNQLVFHYPPQPSEYGFQPTPLDSQVLDNDNDDYSSSSDEESFINDDDSFYRRHSFSGSSESIVSGHASGYSTGKSFGSLEGRYASGRDILDLMEERDKRKLRKAEKRQMKLADYKGSVSTRESELKSPIREDKKEYKIEKLFTFDPDFIAEIGTPPKALCNTRFELTVEDMVFLGLPIRIGDDGRWRPSKKMATKKSASTRRRSSKEENYNVTVDNHENISDKKMQGTSDDDEGRDNGMYQFHLMFVMNPPVVEYNHRINQMFHYIISRLSLLLRYEQDKHNYVWEESQKILKMKEDLVHLPINAQWDQIIEKTSLGKLMYQIFNSVSKSEILNVEINGRARSFQIPIRSEFKSLPPRHLDLPEGSTLFSISPFSEPSLESQSNSETENITIAQFALILLDNTDNIIRDIRVENNSIFASFIRMIKPSESLSRLSILSGLDIQEVTLFANHLVYWRRAKVILPLSSRNIYVISPLAPIKNICKDTSIFNKDFPALPSITTFLSMISSISNAKPKPISVIIPSKDHREVYLDALSWLLKRGYIIQLCTFIYLKISKDIKIQVEEEIEMEVKKAQKTNYRARDRMESEDEESSSDVEVDNTALRNTDNTAHNQDSKLKKTGFQIRFEEDEEEDTILLDPEYSTALERRWIAKLVSEKPPEVVNLFYKLLKYMNGRFCLELFILQEGVSRGDIKKLYEVMGDSLVTVRHW
ncbi:Npr3 protein [Martiniozyma asiatica (nom. inval.)]|nr:Npr3 protein [Martiniozyma asiatica]